MMSAGSEEQAPPLREQMRDDREIFTFHSWMRRYTDEDMQSQMNNITNYDTQQNSFVESFESDDLRAAIERYKAENPDHPFWRDFSPARCSWEKVLGELDEAKQMYMEKGTKNPLRRGLRHGSGIARNLKPLLEGIPQDDGLGFIKGGFIIIFNAVKRRSDACERIFDLFQHIPETIIKATDLRRIFPKEERLFSCTNHLNNQLVKCIPEVINILLRQNSGSSIKKLGRAVFGDPLADLDEILKPLSLAENRLEECRRHLDTRNIAEITTASKSTLSGLEAVHQGVETVDQKLTQFTEDMTSKFDSWKAERDETRESLASEAFRRAIREDIQEIVSSIYPFITETMQMRNREVQAQAQTYGVKHAMPQYPTRVQLMEILCDRIERLAPTRDQGMMLQKYHAFSRNSHARVSYLMVMPQFQGWLMDDQPDILLVDGHCHDQSLGKVSPLSVFCAALFDIVSDPHSGPVHHLPSHRPRVVLSFFCGQHTTQAGSLQGPLGLIMSLIDQLLLQWPEYDPVDLSFLAYQPELWDAVGQHDLHSLCYLFGRLLEQLRPDTVVYCIIDGISHFETSLGGWRDSLGEVVNCFLSYVFNNINIPGAGACVKFLLGSSDKSTVIRHIVPLDHHIDLRAGNMHTKPVSQNNLLSEMRSQFSSEEHL